MVKRSLFEGLVMGMSLIDCRLRGPFERVPPTFSAYKTPKALSCSDHMKLHSHPLAHLLIAHAWIGLMLLGSCGARDGERVEWVIGFNQHGATAIGKIEPSARVMQVIEAAKRGAFADSEDAAAWQERVLGFMNDGLMTGRSSQVLFAPGIGLPANQMNAEQFTEVMKLLAQIKEIEEEKILAFVTSGDGEWELWTTEAIYAHGFGGGMSRVQKTSYGWNFPTLMFDGEKEHLEVLRFWDLALSNDTMQEMERPKEMGPAIGMQIVKLVIDRTIEPKAVTTLFATEPKRTDHVLFIQNECRRFMSSRVVRALQKDKPMLTNHSGFRCAKWGSNFNETCHLLMPFLLHDDEQPFVSSRPTPDVASLYSSHSVSTSSVAKTIDAALWPSVLELQVQQITQDPTTQFGIIQATRSFGGRAGLLEEFIQTTGIPVAPDFDYWSYATPLGRYTAWFIDDQFYGIEIEPSTDAAKHLEEVMADLNRRYGEFTDQPGPWGKSRYIHEDESGGTVVMYEPSGNKKELKRIYHYSLKMRPMVNAKLSMLKTEAARKLNEEKAATMKKASQF